MYDWLQDTWAEMPGMAKGRYYHGCGLATRDASDGVQEVVVAGGFQDDSAEIFNLAKREWRYERPARDS